MGFPRVSGPPIPAPFRRLTPPRLLPGERRSGRRRPAKAAGRRGVGREGLMAVGQVGQSLDGRVATESGHSHYINGPAGLAHLHRLRALVDAVVVGVGTALTDNPQLTVRRVTGPQPARVVIDSGGRLSA